MIPPRTFSTDLVYRFDPPLISEYQGSLDLSTLFAKYPGPHENLNITSFRITNVSLPVNSTINGIFGLINKRIDLGRTQLSIPGKDIKISLNKTITEWSTKQDNYINSGADSSGKMVSNSRDLNITGALLHETGKLDNEYYSTIYSEHAGNPALINQKSLFTIDAGHVVQDNPNVIVHNHPSINGMYHTRLLGIDKKSYGPLRVDYNNIYYTGKGSKNADSFEPNLTENPGKRLFPITAQWDTAAGIELQLSYQDKNGSWITILEPDDPIADAENNILTYWDVSGLNGQYLLKLQVIIDNRIKLITRNIYVGEAVDASTPVTIQSAKGEAELAIPTGSLNDEELISVDAAITSLPSPMEMVYR
jgi:hypothetical protein